MARNDGVETVGERLRRLRIGEGLSQRELAAPGVSYAYISRIEAGTRIPSVRALRKLAPKLGVTPEYLETGSEGTTTDALLERLAGRLDPDFLLAGGPDLIVCYRAPDGGYAVEFDYDGPRRIDGATTLTDVLDSALVWLDELERFRAERRELEARSRSLDEAESAALSKGRV